MLNRRHVSCRAFIRTSYYTENTRLAEIRSRGVLALAREKLPFGELLPHKYEITVDDASTVPKEPIVAAAMVIDAIQGD